MVENSRIPGFYKLSGEERIAKLKELCGLTEEECNDIFNTGALEFSDVDRMIENVVGTFDLPLGIAMNFKINGKDYLIPMAIEEPSVVAAASKAAKIAREKGGFWASATDQIMIGQIQVVNVPDPNGARMEIYRHKEEILELANAQ
ncbi:MAG TPA: 3-hydroxy-3-methylglutaryl-CoA reductase, partial [Thermoplasmata archaeon]|nr:3-hydroxy-3-methylglutaryl-CoA reductase [Thermoplasmata archaeon]